MHFLRKAEVVGCRELGKPWACVKVKLASRQPRVLTLCAGMPVLGKSDAEFCLLPEDVEVRAPTGEILTPSKGRHFYVSTETFDPFHLVTELPDT